MPVLRFIEPCLPSRADRPPTGSNWIHEIKHDGFRLMARRDPVGIRLITRRGERMGDPLSAGDRGREVASHDLHRRDRGCIPERSRSPRPEVVGARRCVRVLKATAKRYLDGDDELLIHPQQALRRPRRHAVERMLLGVTFLGPRCCPTLLPAHLSRSLQSKGSRPEPPAFEAAARASFQPHT
jgi:hypothetical protein